MDEKLAYARSSVDKTLDEMSLHWDDKEQKIAFRVNHNKLKD